MIVAVVTLAIQVPKQWLLGPSDLLQSPVSTSPNTRLRQEVEARYYATPFYERDTLAQHEAAGGSGIARLVWMSFSPRWRGEPRIPGQPAGTLSTSNDREVLRARLLADGSHLYYAAYKPLLNRLMALPGATSDYRLLRLASRSQFLVGGDFAQALPFAKKAEALRPKDPTTWWTMKDVYYNLIVHGVGNGQENWKSYVRYSDLCKDFASTSKSATAQQDLRNIPRDRRWLGEFLKRHYRPDGKLKE